MVNDIFWYEYITIWIFLRSFYNFGIQEEYFRIFESFIIFKINGVYHCLTYKNKFKKEKMAKV